MKGKSTTARILQTVATIGGGAATLTLLGVGAVVCYPAATATLIPRPRPTSSYEEALQRFTQLCEALDGPHINPVCRSQLLTHGHSTDRVVILLHGMTNCPAQFLKLGTMFYEQGCNVLLPRMPHHGLLERETHDLKHLKAEELRSFADTAVDIAQGLGKRVMVLGLSAGGVITTWITQFRADVERTVIVSPALGLLNYPDAFQPLLMNIARRMPNRFMLVGEGDASVGPQYTYMNHTTHALAEMMRLGEAAARASRKHPPAVRSIILVTNANDQDVKRSYALGFLDRWQRHPGVCTNHFEFPLTDQLIHDLIDPCQPEQKTDIVYPILQNFILQD
ncbi:MAG: Lysophospholipase, alpha-beta hydrolase superfamily [Chloroflexi bacterium AL-W]|nr:Lysophospholipase, alpha-beta hydrolase superfamily [Chloroflexi bacterium AL-N1]NOK67659.1 Lysophospholipase, alpha-beta hydrolase superfamily [Chloroflexi bacterium AL-N10]NOK75571.1 Lysophospholipase, alpha-beta hydrolase superfamily [Chloroflexi bacterium AL-N5]NOK82359.1 Lysophospholipase, alpha-beta hydrolase superfamily [Chloroflexi bacterium AL-W]NOK90204.1 Lysophospholipase, alpha-beta hydrolase superfamily [Chloroflexi bacterium AL-N15]